MECYIPGSGGKISVIMTAAVALAGLAEIERDLSAAVDDLQAAIVDGDNGVISQLARKADTLLSERNRLCKLNKE